MCAITALVLAAACQDRDVEAQIEAANASAMLEQNRIAEARMAINRALILRDDVAEFHIARGRIEYAAGVPTAAFDSYFNALTLDATNPEALQAVSQLGLQTGNIRESLRATDTLVLLNPGDTTALITRGVHSLISNRLDEADGYATRALAANPSSDEAMILRSRIMYLKGRYEDALALLEQHSRDRTPSAGIHLMRLELFRARRDREGMDAQFNALRSTDQSTWQLKVDEANFLFKTGRRDAAFELTVELLSSPELSREALLDLIGLWDAWAIDDLPAEAARKILTTETQASRYNVAVFLARQSALSVASRIANSLEGNDQKAVEAFIAYGSGRVRQATRLSQDILAKDSTHCLAREVQARINLANGKMREALSDAQQLAAQCPNEGAGWIIAAQAYGGLGDPENAQRVLQQGSEVNPQDLAYAVEHSRWLRGQGNNRRAIAVARRLTRDAPALVRGWELYRELCRDAADPCLADAERGLADSRTRYWIDFKPGESPPPGLFGRLKDI